MMNQEVKDMFNEVILSGRLGKLEHLQLRGDPETDNCMCYFDVASSYYSKTTEEQYTDWIHCKVWGNLAKRFVNNAREGMLIEVKGRLKNETYNEQERTFVIVTGFRLYKTAPRVESEPVEINEEELNKNEF